MTNEDGIEGLLGIDDPKERILALKSHVVQPYHLRLALQDEDPQVREFAAKHAELTPELIREIIAGHDRWLASVVLSRPDLTGAELDAALGHEDLLQQAATHPSLTEEQRLKIIDDPSTPEALRMQLSGDDGENDMWTTRKYRRLEGAAHGS